MAPATLKMEDGMFNNLIESSSHARELKRRGSFVLFTTSIYVVLFIVAGVVSIYAFDARLEEPGNEMIVTMLPMEPAAVTPQTTHNTAPRPNTARPNQVVRQVAMSSVNDPRNVPLNTSATPNRNLPIPDRGSYVIGAHDSDPVGVPGSGRPGVPGGTNDTVSAVHVDVGTPPLPPAPVERRPPAVKSMGVITGLAISLPKPAYPAIAKQAHAGGAVSVQVLVDETGKVISAKAVKGHPLLLAAAQQAAYGARFSPTKLSNQPVKVSGMITYNFVLQ